MKILFSVFSCLALLAFSSFARADHHKVFIHDVLLLDSSTCAVELQITANNQTGFEGVDRIEINKSSLVSIGDTEAAALNAGKHTNAGDSVLFASNSFKANTGLQPDVTFDNARCASFVAGAVFTYVIDDTAFGGPNAVIDSVTLPSGITTNTATFSATDSSALDLINLSVDTVVVSNNANAEVELGKADNGGCRLGGSALPSPSLSLGGLGLFALGLLRVTTSRKERNSESKLVG